MNGNITGSGDAWLEGRAGEKKCENSTETAAIWLALTRTVTWHDESLLKACVSRQEKATACHRNSAAADAHRGDLRVFQFCGKKKIAGTAHLHALVHVDALSRLNGLSRDKIA